MTNIGGEAGEVYLNPGDIWFGGGHVRLHTVLGSCVSVTLWHPRRRIGGMCHFMLPGRSRPKGSQPSGKYADEAFQIFDREMELAGTRPAEYQAKVFGGGNMFPGSGVPNQGSLGQRNFEVARSLLAARGIDTVVQHVGGAGHRKLLFEVWSGHAWLSFQDLQPGSAESL